MTIDFTPSRDLFPFESKWFESSVGRVHYVDEGDGRPIVFCHGQPMWSFLYRHIVLGLRDRFRCVVIDYPGYGLSVRPEDYGYAPREHAGVLGELVDHLELDDMIVMGQDWGGPISMSMAAARSDRVSGLILGNTWFWKDVSPTMRLFSKFMSTGFMQRRILENNWFVERGIPTGTSTKLSDEVMENYRAVEGHGFPSQIPGPNESSLPRPSSGGTTRSEALHPRGRPGRDHRSHHRPVRVTTIDRGSVSSTNPVDDSCNVSSEVISHQIGCYSIKVRSRFS